MPHMRIKSVLAAGACLAAVTAASPGSAALIANLSFTTPTGTASATDSIEVWATLTLGADSDALIVDENGHILSGVSDADYEAAGIDPAEVSYSFLNTFFECSGTFTNVCISGPPYDFDFNFDPPTLTFGRDINLQAGESAQFLFGTFTPVGGVAPAGTYSFYNMGLTFNPVDENGEGFENEFGYNTSITIATTCPGQNPDCAFTRTIEGVSAVPEPASWAMMIAGFGAVGGAMRRRAGYRLSYSA